MGSIAPYRQGNMLLGSVGNVASLSRYVIRYQLPGTGNVGNMLLGNLTFTLIVLDCHIPDYAFRKEKLPHAVTLRGFL